MPQIPSQFRAIVHSWGRGLALSALLTAAAPPLRAQVVGQNVNMVSGTEWPGGDPFLQRQNEPSIDVSTRNPLHLLAGANDYRTVDVPFADQLPTEGNAGDAWLGLFKSFDGGRTWQSVLLPGYPQDRSADGLASPLKGFAAGADATVRAGANGVFLYSGIAFNRGNNAPGVLFVARFIDNNNKENGDATLGRDPIEYAGTIVVDTGNAGQFLDKPTLAIDVPRSGAAPCTFRTPKDGGSTLTQTFPGGRAYLAYTVFVGGNNNLHTKLLVAASADCGATWANPVKVTEGSHIDQGAAIAIDPATGAINVAWRRLREQEGTERHFRLPLDGRRQEVVQRDGRRLAALLQRGESGRADAVRPGHDLGLVPDERLPRARRGRLRAPLSRLVHARRRAQR